LWLAELAQQGFPAGLISVEKGLQHMAAPLRRADILCYRKGDEGLSPLLLIECKATKLTKKALTQVIAYNYYVGALFIAVANQAEIQFGWSSADGYQFINYLPTFAELMVN